MLYLCDEEVWQLHLNRAFMQKIFHLSKVIHEQAKKYGNRAALYYRDYDVNRWKPISWNEFSSKVKQVSYALLRHGVKVQENIAVFSQNKPETHYVDFGAYGVRVCTIPFYATSSAAQITYMINDAQIRFVFVGEQEQYDTAFSVLSVANTLEHIVIFDPTVKKNPNDHISVYFSEFIEEEKGVSMEFIEKEYEARQADANHDDLANILYTSGTTGNSKGVILTFGQYDAALINNVRAVPVNENDTFLNFLPFTHVFERGWSYLGITVGATQYINLKPADVLQSMQEVHPTCMTSVPRFWEKVYQAVLEKIQHGSAVESKLIADALGVGVRYWRDYKSKCKPAPLGLRLKYKLYDKLVISRLRKTLGLDNPHIFPAGGAAVVPEVENFVHAAGINMVCGYGLTESMATVTCDMAGTPISPGAVGRIIEGVEVKFGENDEILLRGKSITKGYYKKEALTAEAIDADGWFHTGDAGYMKDGELFLRERIKDLFKTSNGKYIAPQMIESKLVVDPYFDQVVVIADKRKFVSALIVPAFGHLKKLAEKHGIDTTDRAALCQNPQIIKFYTSRIATLHQDLAHYEQIKRFILLPEGFSIENGELTNTLKIKRRVVNEHYAEQIDKMYADAEAHR